MSIQPGAAVRVVAGPRVDAWTLLGYLAIGLAALLPRVLALGLFITDDEANFWLTRSDIFLKAIRTGDYVPPRSPHTPA